MPLVQTRQSGPDLYVYPESAVSALAEGTVDEELFNVTGLIRQGYDDSHADAVPLIATYTGDTARRAPLTPRGAERGAALDVIDGLALKADKKRAAAFWADLTAPRSRSGAGLKKLWLDRKVQASLDKSTKQVGADLAWAMRLRRDRRQGRRPGHRGGCRTPRPPGPDHRIGELHRRRRAPTTARATAPMSRPPSAAPARRAEERTRASHPAPT